MKKLICLLLVLYHFPGSSQNLEFVQLAGKNSIDLTFNNDSTFPKLSTFSHYICCLNAPDDRINPDFDVAGNARIFNNSNIVHHNVYLRVSSLDSLSQLVTHLYSDTIATLNTGDTAFFSSQAMLSQEILQTKTLHYQVISDEGSTIGDSLNLNFFIKNSSLIRLYFDEADGAFNTSKLCSDGCGIAMRIPVWNKLSAIEIALHIDSSTIPGGDIFLEIYKDSLHQNDPQLHASLVARAKTIKVKHLNDTVLFKFHPLLLASPEWKGNFSFYYATFFFFDNNGNNPIALKTSKRLRQCPKTLLYSTGPYNWNDQYDTVNFIGNPHIDFYTSASHLDPFSVEEPKQQFGIYPNPGSSFINIYNTGGIKSDNFKYILYNSRGQLIKKAIFTFNNDTYTLDVSGLAPGIYTIIIEDGSVNATPFRLQVH